ncbi:MAG: hypothetical protein GY938_05075 [Ketobacter sp.]|nr:hypothetical protein [Ketobacter sp.]
MTFEQWLQSRLTAHGFPCGVIDGIIGPITIAALKAFEKAHGLSMDGTADPRVVKALRAPAGFATPKQMVAIPDRDEDSGEPTPMAPNQWPRQRNVPEFYGKRGINQTRVEIPFDMVLAWDRSYRIKTMTLHKRVAESASRVLQNVSEIYNENERRDLGINIFSGSLNVRKMRGGSRYSMHSWGIAIDFDNQRNQLKWHKPRARLSHDDAIPFWEEWEKEGWVSLGRARDFDWMHVQAARL